MKLARHLRSRKKKKKKRTASSSSPGSNPAGSAADEEAGGTAAAAPGDEDSSDDDDDGGGGPGIPTEETGGGGAGGAAAGNAGESKFPGGIVKSWWQARYPYEGAAGFGLMREEMLIRSNARQVGWGRGGCAAHASIPLCCLC